MNNKEKALQTILDQGLLPLFFHKSPETSLKVIQTLYKAGIRTLEYTNRGKEALDNFIFLKKELAATCPDMQLGIGTVKTIEEANSFLKAGADYIVAPIVSPEVGRVVHEAGLLWIPGCMTPSEIHIAQQNNASLIKVFPANILGPEYIASIKDLFIGQLFIPTGGVEIDTENIKNWFKAGVCAVGMGSKLISKEVLEEGNFEWLYNKTLEALNIIRSVKA
jgi:2-dehydro-3-deoxyphosphogluconate aldolase/(4S)-4-hydroxy-2-oxoglutarate aldolase